MLLEKDFDYKANAYEYKVFYKNISIGGAGIHRHKKLHWRHAKANVKDNAKHAKQTIRDILQGRIRPDMQKAIDKIDS